MSAEKPFGHLKPGIYQSLIMFIARYSFFGRGYARKLLARLLKATKSDFLDIHALNCKFRASLRDNNPELKMILRPDHYAAAEISFLRRSLKAGDVFVDIGANAGIFTLVAADVLAGNGRVISFEPNPTMFDRLKKNISFNPGTDITPIQAAVSDTAGSIWFDSNEAELGGSHVSSAKGEKSIEVQSCILHEKLLDLGVSQIAGIKIDVEGHEDHAILPFLDQESIPLPHFIIMETIFLKHRKSCLDELRERGYRAVYESSANVCLLLDEGMK